MKWSKAFHISMDLGHYAWVIPAILIVSGLSFHQMDRIAPSRDEFDSLIFANGIGFNPYSPSQTVHTILTYAPDHSPGYFLILNIWGRITSFDVAIARLLTIFAGLITLAISYRLGNDFVGPGAGLIAVAIVASNAFFNHYYAHIRMYPMSTLASGIILWIYLRIMYQCRQVRSGDYLALFAAVFVLCNLHFFNSVFLAVLGVFHLLFAPKNRRWTLVSFAVIVAVLLFIPYPLAAAEGLMSTVEVKKPDGIGMARAIQAWQEAVTNHEPLLLLIVIGGLALGGFRGRAPIRPWLVLPLIFVVFLALLSHYTTFIADFTMRYHLANWLPCALFFTTGFYGLYRFRKYLLVLVILWILAGHHMQTHVSWWSWLNLRSLTYSQPPTQVISRLAQRADPSPSVLFSTDDYFYESFLTSPGFNKLLAQLGHTPAEYFFGRHGIQVGIIKDSNRAADRFAITSPAIWVVAHADKLSADRLAYFDSYMDELNYENCQVMPISEQTTIIKYYWQRLGCLAPIVQQRFRSNLINYDFIGGGLNANQSAVLINDRWTGRTGQPLDDYALSYQLISTDGNNVAQLNLPLVHENELRQFSLNIANVPPGAYRLMTILYHSETGEKQAWLDNANEIADMLPLTEIVLH